MHVIEKVNHYRKEQHPFFSFEFFPPKTENGLANLYSRLDRMVNLEPAFIDMTWGAGGSTSDQTLEISTNVQRFFGVDVMMHLTCIGMTPSSLREVLDRARECGIKNILALRGDLPKGKTSLIKQGEREPFRYATDLIEFIRKHYGNAFGLAVGGYPEGHPESSSLKESTQILKAKLDAGADFVITQLFYDENVFSSFLDSCASLQINAPLIPGIMPIHNYERFQRFVELSQIKIPPHILQDLQKIKSDDAKVREYGIVKAVQMCEKLLKWGSPGLHFYTLNLESAVVSVLEQLKLTEDVRSRRALPWRQSALDHRRNEEQVRPIFWSNRPKSYFMRTISWDDFPNGRWGSSFSPTYGDLTDYYMFRKPSDKSIKERARLVWGEPKSLSDVCTVFKNFCLGNIDGLPWCETPLQRESGRISQKLADLNAKGFLTINSQPQVNGASSSDPEVGWGGPGGIVYQKAYIEFFCSSELFQQLQQKLPTLPSLTYHAIRANGESISNLPSKGVTAVSWGVFPGKEILQPTVVDPESFNIWKDEAFGLWLSEWRSLYEVSSASYSLLTHIHDTFYLVNVVENDFMNGNIFHLFEGLGA